MNPQSNARGGNVAKKNTNGDFDVAMGYGWASTESAWEKITSRASWSVVDARATLGLISLMEQAGVADLPRAAYNMRAASKVANKTIRDHTMRLAYPRKVGRR